MTYCGKPKTCLSEPIPSPKIYVACLSSYVNGILYGKWIDASQEIEALRKEIKQMLADSPMPGAEEFAIHTFEGFFCLSIEGYESIESVQEQAAFILEHGELGGRLIAYYGEVEAARTALEEYYRGEYDSELEYAIQLFDECYLNGLPEFVRFYLDYEKFQRDIFIDDYFSIEVRGRCHVFESH